MGAAASGPARSREARLPGNGGRGARLRDLALAFARSVHRSEPEEGEKSPSELLRSAVHELLALPPLVQDGSLREQARSSRQSMSRPSLLPGSLKWRGSSLQLGKDAAAPATELEEDVALPGLVQRIVEAGADDSLGQASEGAFAPVVVIPEPASRGIERLRQLVGGVVPDPVWRDKVVLVYYVVHGRPNFGENDDRQVDPAWLLAILAFGTEAILVEDESKSLDAVLDHHAAAVERCEQQQAPPILLEPGQWLGFDLDHTLVTYRTLEMYNVLYAAVMTHLEKPLAEAVLPPRLLAFTRKGLHVDKRHGYLIQLDGRRRVAFGFVGEDFLTRKEMLDAGYLRSDASTSTCVQEELEDTPRFSALHTHFEQTFGAVLATLVRRQQSQEDRAALVEAITAAFVFTQSKFCSFGFETHLTREPARFVSREPGLERWLKRLRDTHRVKLFLLTNSDIHHTHIGLCRMFGPGWPKLFDLVINDARKSKFFNASAGTAFVDNSDQAIAATGASEGSVFRSKGNAADLNRRFLDGARVTYVGDHVIQDCVSPSQPDTSWNTVAILPSASSHLFGCDVASPRDSDGDEHATWLATLLRTKTNGKGQRIATMAAAESRFTISND